MLLVMALELDGQIEEGLLQQAAGGAELIGGDRFLFGTQRSVQNDDVVVHRLGICRADEGQAVLTGQQRNGRCRQSDLAQPGKEAPATGWVGISISDSHAALLGLEEGRRVAPRTRPY